MVEEDFFEELIRTEAEEFAVEKFGLNYCDLPPVVQFWLRNLAIQRLCVGDDFPAPVIVDSEKKVA